MMGMTKHVLREPTVAAELFCLRLPLAILVSESSSAVSQVVRRWVRNSEDVVR
jgi:hypothetical protein